MQSRRKQGNTTQLNSDYNNRNRRCTRCTSQCICTHVRTYLCMMCHDGHLVQGGLSVKEHHVTVIHVSVRGKYVRTCVRDYTGVREEERKEVK